MSPTALARIPHTRAPKRLLTGIAVAIVVAACGSSTPSGSSGGGNIKTDSAGHVSFGVLSCFTGPLAVLGQAMLQGSQVAQKVINDSGGVLGKQLDLSHARHAVRRGRRGPGGTPAPLGRQRERHHRAGDAGDRRGGSDRRAPPRSPPSSRAAARRSTRTPTSTSGGTARRIRSSAWPWRSTPIRRGTRRRRCSSRRTSRSRRFPSRSRRRGRSSATRIVSNITVAPGQTSYLTEVQQIIAAHPDVIFTQLDPQTAAVMFQNFKELDNLAIPIVGTDVTSGNDYLKAITYPIAHDHLVSVYRHQRDGRRGRQLRRRIRGAERRQCAADRRRELRVRRGDQPRAGDGQGGYHRRSGGHRRDEAGHQSARHTVRHLQGVPRGHQGRHQDQDGRRER